MSATLSKRLHHLRLQLGLDRGERQGILHVVLVHVGFARRLPRRARARSRAVTDAACGGTASAAAGAVAGAAICGGATGRPRPAPADLAVGRRDPSAADRDRHRLGVGTGIGRFEIDDVAQEDLSFVQLVAPDDDGLERQRALAQPGDHRLAAGLDALGDGDFAFAREQFDRAHFAQIHAHRIVGALARLGLLGLGRRPSASPRPVRCRSRRRRPLRASPPSSASCSSVLDDVDAHLVEHREHVFDLVGGDFLRRHHRVDLLVGDIAALLRELDHLLDFGIGQIEQRQRRVGGGLGGFLLRALFRLFGRAGLRRCLERRRLLHGLRRGLGGGVGRGLGGRLGRRLGDRFQHRLGDRLMRRFGGFRRGFGSSFRLRHHNIS